MKSQVTCALTLGLILTLGGCVLEPDSYYGGESTHGIYYTPNYDYYTRTDEYPAISGGSYYNYGGRYEGGGYGYGAPFNH
jgi:hypothetical protein